MQHLEFPFTATHPLGRPGTRVDEPAPTTARARHRARQNRRRKLLRSKMGKRIVAIVKEVSDARGVPWQKLFQPNRGHPATASARTLAMALCAAADVPLFIIARAFSRPWATVYKAETRCADLYRMDTAFRKEWDKLTKACIPSP